MNERRFERMLAWYPRQWRERNGAAVLGTLLDQAEAEGHTSPTFAARTSFALAGLGARFTGTPGKSMPMATALGLGLAFCAWYLAVIAWSPGIDTPGSIGPFTNPLAVVGVVLLLSLVLLIVGQRAAGRGVAALGVVAAVALSVAGSALHWLGPDAATAALVAGFALLAASPLHTVRAAVRASVVITLTFLVLELLSALGGESVTVVRFALLVVGLAVATRQAWRR